MCADIVPHFRRGRLFDALFAFLAMRPPVLRYENRAGASGRRSANVSVPGNFQILSVKGVGAPRRRR